MPPDYVGEFEQLVLMTILRLGEQAYGATVRDEIADRVGRDVSLSALYTTLERRSRSGERCRVRRPRGGRVLDDLFIGVTPGDGLTLATVVLVLGGAALVACLSPARRASKLDPVQALRREQ